MRAKKVDGNHAAIRDHLRAVGWSVFDAHDVGRGFGDLVCARRGFTALVEIKIPGKKLNHLQESFVRGWGGVYLKVTTPENAEQQLAIAEQNQYLRWPAARAA